MFKTPEGLQVWWRPGEGAQDIAATCLPLIRKPRHQLGQFACSISTSSTAYTDFMFAIRWKITNIISSIYIKILKSKPLKLNYDLLLVACLSFTVIRIIFQAYGDEMWDIKSDMKHSCFHTETSISVIPILNNDEKNFIVLWLDSFIL